MTSQVHFCDVFFFFEKDPHLNAVEETSEKISFHPWKIYKIVWRPLAIPRSKSWNFHMFFLQYLWNAITTISNTTFQCRPRKCTKLRYFPDELANYILDLEKDLISISNL